MNKLNETSPYFTERQDATGLISLTPLQKCTTTLRQLAYVMTSHRQILLAIDVSSSDI
jgi:hypothetical protein